MKVGYARVSTDDQHRAMPLDVLHQAERRGVRFGRPLKLCAAQQALARRLLTEGTSVKEVAGLFGVHVATVYRLADTDSA